jgi:hypothetical protein
VNKELVVPLHLSAESQEFVRVAEKLIKMGRGQHALSEEECGVLLFYIEELQRELGAHCARLGQQTARPAEHPGPRKIT